MLEVKGKHNTAIVYTDNLEPTALSQIIELCNQDFVAGSKVRIMPDVHAGAGCTIGTTMTFSDKIVPNLVGVDIGCGMYVVKLADRNIEPEKLDKVIRQYVPSGMDIRAKEHKMVEKVNLQGLKCAKKVNLNRARCSIGTLGGGNHFIEANQDEKDNLYLVIHSGSRHLGKQIAEYYQEQGYQELVKLSSNKQEIIEQLKAEGRIKDIQSELKRAAGPKEHRPLAYVQGETFQNYIHDMRIAQDYAVWNRRAIAAEIIKYMGLKVKEEFTTIHNYIDTGQGILRKGAISAQLGERVLIPLNMRDGSMICIGKGNPEWNYSAPHGAGRLMSRVKAKETFTLKEFKESMSSIYSTSVNKSTIDECPMVYKPKQEIIQHIQDTVELVSMIKPVYNFKNSED